MGQYLDLAKKATAAKTRHDSVMIDGHQVQRVIWQTDKAVIFADEYGRFWRYLHAYGQSWPVVIMTNLRDQD
jgi:hypothetical protein